MNAAKSLLRIVLLLAVTSAVALLAQTPPPASTNAIATERFLVVVETSAAMQKRAENTQKALGSVISSGLSGHMISGSTIGMWTFNDKLTTGQFPLQLWTPPTRQRVAGAMVQFLQQQKNEKAGQLAIAWEAVTNIVAHSEHITVLLISSGNDPIAGTPFDATINESFSKNADVQRKQNMPFLTILRAARGRFVSFAVNMPPWPLEVPEYPDGFKPAPPLPPSPPPKIETNPPPAVVKRPDPAILSPTNTIFLTETSSPVVRPINPPPPQLEPTNPVVAAQQSAPPLTSAPAPVLPAVKTETNPLPQAAVPVEKNSPPVVPATVEKRFPMVTVLVGSIAMLLAILTVFLALLRRSRRATGTSLITRSMSKHDR